MWREAKSSRPSVQRRKKRVTQTRRDVVQSLSGIVVREEREVMPSCTYLYLKRCGTSNTRGIATPPFFPICPNLCGPFLTHPSETAVTEPSERWETMKVIQFPSRAVIWASPQGIMQQKSEFENPEDPNGPQCHTTLAPCTCRVLMHEICDFV